MSPGGDMLGGESVVVVVLVSLVVANVSAAVLCRSCLLLGLIFKPAHSATLVVPKHAFDPLSSNAIIVSS